MKTNIKEKIGKYTSTKAFKIGGYNKVLIVIVLGIAVLLNLLVMALPGNITALDISSSKLYSITSNTKVILSNLEKDVTIYWICQTGSEDTVIEKLLDKYSAESSHVSVVKKNPDVYPTFAEDYTSGTVYNNDLVVECGSKYSYISYYDIYEYETSSYSYYSYATYFDGEGQITSAINYVTSDTTLKVYTLSGHGELDISDTIVESLTKENIELEDISLLTVDEMPEDASALIIYSPDTDISEIEKEMLISYIQDGGSVIILSGALNDEALPNLDLVASYYGITRNEGIVFEGNRNYYAFGYPYILLPEIESSEITDAQIDDGSYILMPLSSGLSLDENSSFELTTLLSTSTNSYSKIDGYDVSYEKEEDDQSGPFALAVLAVDNTENNEGKLLYIASSYMIDDVYISYSSEANLDFLLNSLAWMTGQEESVSIRAKSLDYEYLTISDAQAGRIKTVLLGVVPAAFLAMGLVEVISRKKKLA